MQSCLLLGPEPYLYRDNPKHALRTIFNSIAMDYFPDVRMLCEHVVALDGTWRGDHYKSSDEANAAGWLRQIFVREDGDALLIGQTVPQEWLQPGKTCGLQRGASHFGPVNVTYTAEENTVTAKFSGATRNPPKTIRIRFRHPAGLPFRAVTVNGTPWRDCEGEWACLPGRIANAEVVATW